MSMICLVLFIISFSHLYGSKKKQGIFTGERRSSISTRRKVFFHGHSEQPVAGDTGEVLITTYQVVQTDQDKLCSGAGFAVVQTIAGYNKDMEEID